MTIDIQTFPGYQDNELDLTKTSQAPVGIPAGLIGAAERGPAFVPWSNGSFADYANRFGGLNSNYPSTYAADFFLANRGNLTFMRVLGAGANQTIADIEATRTTGTVKNAGFFISASAQASGAYHENAVSFLVARHDLATNEAFGFPIFTNNDSYNAATGSVNLVRGVLFSASGSRIQFLNTTETYAFDADSFVTPDSNGLFKVAISASVGATFANDDGFPGVRLFTASLDPLSDNYFAKVLNTDPQRFEEYKHYVYADFAVDAAVASCDVLTGSVGIVSGSGNVSAVSGLPTLPYLQAFGKFNARYQTAKTPWFISQPYGQKEYDLFRFKAIDDGEYPNDKIKISITNLQASVDPRNPYGTFAVAVRKFDDTDFEPVILEQFINCTLDPDSENYIARKIGDLAYTFNFDAENEDDRRIVVSGRYPNMSRYVRIELTDEVEKKEAPGNILPFGFRGPQILKTNPQFNDFTAPAAGTERLVGSGSAVTNLLNAIIPPLPYTFKSTRGAANLSATYLGQPGANEVTDPRLYWGVKTTTVEDVTNPNISTTLNPLVKSYTRFMGVEKLDMLTTGSYSDDLNENKFTLARVALNKTTLAQVTGSVSNEMREAAYVRNGNPDGTNYFITDPISSNPRVTLATLLQRGENATVFNRFNQFAKFTVPLFGGFDGTNILSKDDALFTDRSTSQDARGTETGHANSSHVSKGFYTAQAGTGLNNSAVLSFRTAVDLLTDPFVSSINILGIPAQRDSFVTDYALQSMNDYGLGVYLYEIPDFNTSNERIFFGETGQYFDVEYTADNFESRAIDNEFGVVYYPDFKTIDRITKKNVTLPASIAGLSAIGYTDKVAYAWFAPAGFNRAALDGVVKSTVVKLKKEQRDRLFAVDINPIVKFPGEKDYVIFSQETLKKGEGVLTKINVQRMTGDLIRQCVDFGNRNLFDNIVDETYTVFANGFKNICAPLLSKKGLKEFRVVCDSTNNSIVDSQEKRLNARILLVPIGAVEFIQLDFIIVNGSIDVAVSTASV